MKRRLLVLAFIFVAAGAVVLGVVRTAQADNVVTDEQISRIKANCSTARSTLSQLHTSDAFLRVNRGQLYESIDSQLMVPFNQRLANNKLDTSSFTSVTTTYESTLTDFINDYRSYEQELSTTLGVDCTKQPVAFYDDLLSAEGKRSKLHDDVTNLDTAITGYQSALTTLAGTYGSSQP